MADNWMVRDLVGIKGVEHVVLCSTDGLPGQYAKPADKPVTDVSAHLPAAVAGLYSVADGLGRLLDRDSGLRQVVAEWEGRALIVRSAGRGSYLAVVFSEGVDPAIVSQEMTRQVNRLGEGTSTPPRETPPTP